MNGLTLLECSRKAPSIRAISMAIGDAACHSLIVKTLSEMNILTGKQIESSDLDIYAYQIKESFPELKMDEFILTIKNGMEGKYGKVYGKLNYMIINEWLNSSWNELLNAFDEEHRKKKSEPIIIHPDLLPAFEEAKNNFDLNESIEKENKKQEKLKPQPKTERERMETQKILDNYFNEFDKLYADQSGSRTNNNSVRFVQYNGHQLCFEEFINARIEEDN